LTIDRYTRASAGRDNLGTGAGVLVLASTGLVQEGLMLEFTLPQIVFFSMVGGVTLMVVIIVARMLRV
jgi:hypothetical protein